MAAKRTVTAETRTLLVIGEKEFKITIPGSSKVTFGPWSPPKKNDAFNTRGEERAGTLRVYGKNKTDIIACFSGVKSFRDITTVSYEEKVAVEEGATIWKSDEKGYQRESKVKSEHRWTNGEALTNGAH